MNTELTITTINQLQRMVALLDVVRSMAVSGMPADTVRGLANGADRIVALKDVYQAAITELMGSLDQQSQAYVSTGSRVGAEEIAAAS